MSRMFAGHQNTVLPAVSVGVGLGVLLAELAQLRELVRR